MSNAADVTVVVEGAGFLDIPLVALGSQRKATLRTSYHVRVGAVFETDDVERLSTEELAFQLPKGLDPGTYDVVLSPPAGETL